MIVKTGRSGWYFRTIEAGDAEAGESLERIEDGAREWSVLRVFEALIQGKASREELQALAQLPRLSPQIQARAIKRLG